MFHNMTVQGDVSVLGLVSGRDLDEWRDRVVFRDSPHGVVTGEWKIEGNISIMGSVFGDENTLLNNIHLPSLIATHKARTEQADKNKENMRR